MVFKQFHLNTLLRVAGLTISLALLVFFLLETHYYITCFLLFLTVAGQVWSLVRYVNRTNHQVSSFLEAIRHADFTRSFESGNQGKSFDQMHATFQEVLRQFRTIREEKELQFHFLQNLIQHIDIGLLAFGKDGKVELVNNAMKRLFRLNAIQNISDLEVIDHGIPASLQQAGQGPRKIIIIDDREDTIQLMIQGREFKLGNRLITLVSIQNIQHEMEEQEMDAWQKLIRVLTHEIMNSMTPIVSLTAASNELIAEIRDEATHCSENVGEILDDLETSMSLINKRSTGLMHFVELYRNLTRIPRPNFKIFYIKNFIESIYKLHEIQFRDGRVDFRLEVIPEDLEITADEELMEQVLINLMKNSLQALANIDNPYVSIRAFIQDNGRLVLQIEDNGEGILPDVVDKIFVPFFTTKSDGSGIGLSLSKQIMRLHGGNISVRSIPNERTTFYLKF